MNNTKRSRHVQRRINKDTRKSDQDVCIKGNCSCHPKTINVISRDQEFILDTLRKVEDEKTKQNLYEQFDQRLPRKLALRNFMKKSLDLQDQINRIGNQENHMDIPKSSQLIIMRQILFESVSRVIFRATENCLQEGVVPIPLCEESSMSLFGANSKRFTTKYKLIDNLNEKALLGIPFLSSIYPMWVDNQGIRTKLCDKEILFEFANPVESITQFRKSLMKEAQVSPKKILMRIDDSTSYLPDNDLSNHHLMTSFKNISSFAPKASMIGSVLSASLPVEPLLAVDRRLLCKRVGVTPHKVSNQEIYKKGTFKFFTDYTIKTSEMSVSLEQDDQVIRLLDNISVEKHKKNGYNFIHFGMIQVAAKPLTRLGLNTAIVMCLRDNRHLEYRDSIIGAVQAGLNDGPVYFQCYPNFTVRIRDADILDSVVLHIKTHGFKIKPGNNPVSIITRFAYKSMNTSVGSGALCTSPKGELVFSNLLEIPEPLNLFMNLLELQALPSRLEPLGRRRIQLRNPKNIKLIGVRSYTNVARPFYSRKMSLLRIPTG
ncbi:hypothetical protein AAG906_000717 [Vitis piasezkii]